MWPFGDKKKQAPTPVAAAKPVAKVAASPATRAVAKQATPQPPTKGGTALAAGHATKPAGPASIAEPKTSGQGQPLSDEAAQNMARVLAKMMRSEDE